MPIDSCADNIDRVNPAQGDPALGGALELEGALARDDQAQLEFLVNRTARMGVSVWKRDGATSCPTEIWVDGLTDDLGVAQRVALSPINDPAQPDLCATLIDAGGTLVWTPRRYEISLRTDASGDQEVMPYTLRLEVLPPVCSNGYHEIGEECDLGEANSDTTPGSPRGSIYGEVEVCRSTCRLPYCGDGVQDLGEACDHGDRNTDDPFNPAIDTEGEASASCRGDCTLSFCGDGVLDAGEGCDQGDDNAFDAECLPTCVVAVCGDGNLRVGLDDHELGFERCDDGNQEDGDGCSADCSDLEQLCADGNFIPSSDRCPSNDVINVACGDGLVVQDFDGDGIADPDHPNYEECDDNNINAGDGCNSRCRIERVRLMSEVSRRVSGDLHLYELQVDAPGQLLIYTRGGPGQEEIDTCLESDHELTLYLMNPETKRKSSLISFNDDSSSASQCPRIEVNIYRAGTYLIEVNPYQGAPRMPYELSTIFTRDLSGGGSESGQVSDKEYDVFVIKSYELSKLRVTADSAQRDTLRAQLFNSVEDMFEVNGNLTDTLPLSRILRVPNHQDGEANDPDQSDVYLMIQGANQDGSVFYQIDVSPICGDGTIDKQRDDEGDEFGEECDDGARDDQDGCSAWCKIETNLCGNGLFEARYDDANIAPDEECDDGHLIIDQNTQIHLDESRQVMTTSYRVFFDAEDETLRSVELIIDASVFSSIIPAEEAISRNYFYPRDFNIEAGQADLKSLAQAIEGHFPTLIKAYARGNELSLVVRSGKVDQALEISSSAPSSPWNSIDPRAVCDAECSYKVRRLVSRETNTSGAYVLTGKIPENDTDQYLFSVRGNSIFEARTLGCQRSTADQPTIDTQMTLYRLDQGELVSVIQQGDDLFDINSTCPLGITPSGVDTDGDQIDDLCDVDTDGDGIPNAQDNCPIIANHNQQNSDQDLLGDRCDPDQVDEVIVVGDLDQDGITDDQDNCVEHPNHEQGDANGDGEGDTCEDGNDFCSYVYISDLPSGDYLLEVGGYLGGRIPQYKLNYNLSRVIPQVSSSINEISPTALSNFTRDEFTGEISEEVHLLSYQDPAPNGIEELRPYGRISMSTQSGVPEEVIGEVGPDGASKVNCTNRPRFKLSGAPLQDDLQRDELCQLSVVDNPIEQTIDQTYFVNDFQGLANVSALNQSLLIQPPNDQSFWDRIDYQIELPFTYQHCFNQNCGENPCGNGVVDAGELCDDGDEIDDNFCINEC
jgi:cysteine-rich repeat protein